MGLDRALHGLPGDRTTELVVREVLELVSSHEGEWVTATDVSRRLERPESSVSVILSRLADGYVLNSLDGRYRYEHDPVVDLDVRRFLRRSEVHNQYAQGNLAKFRDRYGHR